MMGEQRREKWERMFLICFVFRSSLPLWVICILSLSCLPFYNGFAPPNVSGLRTLLSLTLVVRLKPQPQMCGLYKFWATAKQHGKVEWEYQNIKTMGERKQIKYAIINCLNFPGTRSYLSVMT